MAPRLAALRIALRWWGWPERFVTTGSRGQGIVEYGVILSGSALVALLLLLFMAGPLSDVIQLIEGAIDEAARHG